MTATYPRLDLPLLGDPEWITRPDGTRLHARRVGEGPDVLLAHGFMGRQEDFVIVQRQLVDAGFRVTTFDQRAHGQSTLGTDGLTTRAMAGDYAAALEHFDLRDAVLLGHSMGGFLSVVFAQTHPDVVAARLRGLVLVGAHAGRVAEGNLQNQLQIPLIKRGVMARVVRRPRLGRLMARTLFGSWAPADYVEQTRAGMVEHDMRRTLPILQAQLDEDWYPNLGLITVPTVVLCGERDKTCLPWHSQRLGRDIPNAHNVWLPGVGHMVTCEAPGSILAHVRELARG